MKQLVSRTKPLLVVLENVAGLLAMPGESDDESLSDADYIFTELGRIVLVLVVSVQRHRLWLAVCA